MFWKRKKADSDLLAPDLFYIDSENRRGSYRVNPPEGEPIFIQLNNEKFRLIDIGALGFSFQNKGFHINDEYDVDFYLEGYIKKIFARMYIVSIDEQDICHCAFQELNKEDFEAIHKYMLEKQKEETRGTM